MQIEIIRVALHPVALQLVSPFQTSFGVHDCRRCVLIEVESAGGAVGWGEVTTDSFPGYSYETTTTALHILRDFLIPALLRQRVVTLGESWAWWEAIRGHPLAKHGLLAAIVAATAAENGIPIATLLQSLAGAETRRSRAKVGVSIGIQPSIDATLQRIQGYLNDGYQRVKLKIKPGWDVEMLREVRRTFPGIMLMADANSAYRLDDAPHLKKLDAFDLMKIEQPLAHHDLYEHSKLARQIGTPICLDESLLSLNDVRLAWEIGACQIVNLKPQRVGGVLEAVKIHSFCQEVGMDLWIGGMLESGVGRALSLALAALPGVTMPSDISATNRYYAHDIADPPFALNREDSTITVPQSAGLGVTVDTGRLADAEALFVSAPL